MIYVLYNIMVRSNFSILVKFLRSTFQIFSIETVCNVINIYILFKMALTAKYKMHNFKADG